MGNMNESPKNKIRYKVLVLGHHSVGKTTILQSMKKLWADDIVATVPGTAFHIETI